MNKTFETFIIKRNVIVIIKAKIFANKYYVILYS
jgi:hypothetical protein